MRWSYPPETPNEASLVVHAASGAVAGKATFDSEHTFSSRCPLGRALHAADLVGVGHRHREYVPEAWCAQRGGQ